MASNKCRTTVKRLDCGDDLDNQHITTYDPFEVCLPFGRKLSYDGTGFKLTEAVTIADGQYGIITVENGCITDADEQPACEYTAQPCTPAASGCSESGASSITLQPGEDNILNYDAQQRLGAQINYATSTSGLTISGYGTASSPLTINYTPSAADKTSLKSATPDILPVSGTGTSTDPFYITHNGSALGAGTYGQFTIDNYGHITGYDETGTIGVTAIVAQDGLSVTNSGTIYTITMNRQTTNGTYVLGGYSVTIDGQGIISGITQAITLPVDSDTHVVTFDPFRYYLTCNAYGSIVAMTAKSPDVADDIFVGAFDSGRTGTAMSFTTTKAAYFKVTYKGLLTGSASGSGYVSLPSQYSVKVDGSKVSSARCIYESGKGIIEVCAITDAYYGAGSHSVELTCSTEDFTFTDGAILTVELVAKGS